MIRSVCAQEIWGYLSSDFIKKISNSRYCFILNYGCVFVVWLDRFKHSWLIIKKSLTLFLTFFATSGFWCANQHLHNFGHHPVNSFYDFFSLSLFCVLIFCTTHSTRTVYCHEICVLSLFLPCPLCHMVLIFIPKKCLFENNSKRIHFSWSTDVPLSLFFLNDHKVKIYHSVLILKNFTKHAVF